eukprot:TRINITY_DN606_c0_g1_i1.p2 TRINITY_DN606_c0_g1~~TRINITY_DN606_c0_g1_i1.p2  ORF type:complete len:131 (+),score=39.51 TRINITY_DN606_c0_g1_i1:44-436(+)
MGLRMAIVVVALAALCFADDFDKYIKIDTTTEGDGVSFPKKGNKVKCHYVLTLLDGKEIDSSRKRGQPFEFTIGQGQVIRGWDEALLRFSKGQRAVLTIQPEWGYGARGAGGMIPGNSVLKFDVELIDFS